VIATKVRTEDIALLLTATAAAMLLYRRLERESFARPASIGVPRSNFHRRPGVPRQPVGRRARSRSPQAARSRCSGRPACAQAWVASPSCLLDVEAGIAVHHSDAHALAVACHAFAALDLGVRSRGGAGATSSLRVPTSSLRSNLFHHFIAEPQIPSKTNAWAGSPKR
jgi:hypothetical protein